MFSNMAGLERPAKHLLTQAGPIEERAKTSSRIAELKDSREKIAELIRRRISTIKLLLFHLRYS
jgi:hypothetical protein